MSKESTKERASVLMTRLRQPVGARGPAFGGVPQVSLLPTEVRDAGVAASHRRRLTGLVGVVAAVAVIAVGLAGAEAMRATTELAAANAQTLALNAQVGKFSDVRDLESRIALGKAAVDVGGSTIIDWDAQISAIEADMPTGYTVTTISTAGATPFADYPQGTTSLEPRRAATVTLTVSAPSVGYEYSHWLTTLRRVPAYADANASVVTSDGTSTITLTVHLGPAAISAARSSEQP